MKTIHLTLTSCFLLLSACFGYVAVAGTNSLEKKDSVATYKELGRIAKNITPAIQIAYLHDGQVEHYDYGYKDIAKKDAIDSQTIFQAASLSKVVATYAFLILVDKGILDLDKPLWEYYEYDRLANDRYKKLMTARHVLTHQTGLPNWTKPRGAELKAAFKPGTDYKYSGEAYQYLQLVAEKLTGKSLDEICAEYIFKPFGMEKSTYVYNQQLGENITIGHKDMESTNRVHKFSNGNAAFTLYTTADEYMKFVIEGVLNGKGLSKKLHEDFLTPKVITAAKGKEKEKDKYVKCCFGIRSQDNEAGRAYWHTGSNGAGFQCLFVVYPESKKAITVFTNSNKGRDINPDVLEKFFGKDQTYWLTQR
ncbi:beta-lactamase family protein [Parapedobacter sp. SGR-10]|uniref:serine hydrolase domain-containing protein n=1 Tax=Parapedobacter sp. SGR-10 TaxID=2710879 RepID=UPI0013D3E70D|nr:serine hydrolase domain-containing protein [Parapedobacter sp. SGR-10]NGF57108.1 beta-lactamase family protein [Parapedobacter sp. SGR-10]